MDNDKTTINLHKLLLELGVIENNNPIYSTKLKNKRLVYNNYIKEHLSNDLYGKKMEETLDEIFKQLEKYDLESHLKRIQDNQYSMKKIKNFCDEIRKKGKNLKTSIKLKGQNVPINLKPQYNESTQQNECVFQINDLDFFKYIYLYIYN